MRRLNGPEKGIFALAILFLIVGTDMIVYPTDMVVFHQSFRRPSPHPHPEHITKNDSPVYGVASVLLGVGLVSLIFYGNRK